MIHKGILVAQRNYYRRNNQHWSPAELNRLAGFVKLEDITPPAERFHAAAAGLERTPASVRAKWLDLRNAGLRGQAAGSPSVAEYVRVQYPDAGEQAAGEILDALVAAYWDVRRREEALLGRIFTFAADDAGALAGLRATLLGDGSHAEAARAVANGTNEQPDGAEPWSSGDQRHAA